MRRAAGSGPHTGPAFTDVNSTKTCQYGHAGRVRDVPHSMKLAVGRAYGIRHKHTGEYEVDHPAAA